jgi:hypothetical protein
MEKQHIYPPMLNLRPREIDGSRGRERKSLELLPPPPLLSSATDLQAIEWAAT